MVFFSLIFIRCCYIQCIFIVGVIIVAVDIYIYIHSIARCVHFFFHVCRHWRRQSEEKPLKIFGFFSCNSDLVSSIRYSIQQTNIRLRLTKHNKTTFNCNPESRVARDRPHPLNLLAAITYICIRTPSVYDKSIGRERRRAYRRRKKGKTFDDWRRLMAGCCFFFSFLYANIFL